MTLTHVHSKIISLSYNSVVSVYLIVLLICFNWRSFAGIDRKQQCCPLITLAPCTCAHRSLITVFPTCVQYLTSHVTQAWLGGSFTVLRAHRQGPPLGALALCGHFRPHTPPVRLVCQLNKR